jgi:hypothetical protein
MLNVGFVLGQDVNNVDILPVSSTDVMREQRDVNVADKLTIRP